MLDYVARMGKHAQPSWCSFILAVTLVGLERTCFEDVVMPDCASEDCIGSCYNTVIKIVRRRGAIPSLPQPALVPASERVSLAQAHPQPHPAALHRRRAPAC